jgi:hypothetical protein
MPLVSISSGRRRPVHGSAWPPWATPTRTLKRRASSETIKMEEVYLKEYRTFEEAEGNIGEFIEEVYDRKRLHSSLG